MCSIFKSAVIEMLQFKILLFLYCHLCHLLVESLCYVFIILLIKELILLKCY